MISKWMFASFCIKYHFAILLYYIGVSVKFYQRRKTYVSIIKVKESENNQIVENTDRQSK